MRASFRANFLFRGIATNHPWRSFEARIQDFTDKFWANGQPAFILDETISCLVSQLAKKVASSANSTSFLVLEPVFLCVSLRQRRLERAYASAEKNRKTNFQARSCFVRCSPKSTNQSSIHWTKIKIRRGKNNILCFFSVVGELRSVRETVGVAQIASKIEATLESEGPAAHRSPCNPS